MRISTCVSLMDFIRISTCKNDNSRHINTIDGGVGKLASTRYAHTLVVDSAHTFRRRLSEVVLAFPDHTIILFTLERWGEEKRAPPVSSTCWQVYQVVTREKANPLRKATRQVFWTHRCHTDGIVLLTLLTPSAWPQNRAQRAAQQGGVAAS